MLFYSFKNLRLNSVEIVYILRAIAAIPLLKIDSLEPFIVMFIVPYLTGKPAGTGVPKRRVAFATQSAGW